MRLNEQVEALRPSNLSLWSEWFFESMMGKHRSRKAGHSSSFKEFRPWVPGENPRQIDWKLFAKTEHYFAKRFENETRMEANFILDHSSSMYFPYQKDEENKCQRSICIMALMMRLLLEQKDAFALYTEPAMHRLDLRSGRAHYQACIQHLQELYSSKSQEVPARLSQLLQEQFLQLKGKKLTYLFSDLLFDEGEFQSFLLVCQELKASGNGIKIIRMQHPKEREIQGQKNLNLAMKDLESGQIYQKSLSEWEAYFAKMDQEIMEKRCFPLMEAGIKVQSLSMEASILENLRSLI